MARTTHPSPPRPSPTGGPGSAWRARPAARTPGWQPPACLLTHRHGDRPSELSGMSSWDAPCLPGPLFSGIDYTSSCPGSGAPLSPHAPLSSRCPLLTPWLTPLTGQVAGVSLGEWGAGTRTSQGSSGLQVSGLGAGQRVGDALRREGQGWALLHMELGDTWLRGHGDPGAGPGRRKG